MLQPQERQKLQEVLMSAIRTINNLKQFSDHNLGKNLEEIANCDNLSTAVFGLIGWVESEGHLDTLVNATWKNYSTNPALRKFIEEIWLPLQPQQKPTISLQEEQPEVLLLTEKVGEAQSSPIDIGIKRYAKLTNENNVEQILLCIDDSHLVSSTTNIITELHQHIYIAREAIQEVRDIFQPEKDVSREQCQLAVELVQRANESIHHNLTNSIGTLIIHAPARSWLELERTHFCDESGKIAIFLQEFTKQTSFLPLRKRVWEKLQLLMRSLQEFDYLIDALQKLIEENKVDS